MAYEMHFFNCIINYFRRINEKRFGSCYYYPSCSSCCYFLIFLELAIWAKGIILMYESALDVPTNGDTKATFAELKYLEKSIGNAGKAVLKPLLHSSQKEL
jgi:hypothetical protein